MLVSAQRSFVEITEAGKIEHLGTIAADDADLVDAAAPQRRDLTSSSGAPASSTRHFGRSSPNCSHATAAPGCKDQGAHQDREEQRWNSAMSAAANGGTVRSGCHMMPVTGSEVWRTALMTPSAATAQVSSGARDSKAAKQW